MTWDDNSYGESEPSLGRSPVPLDITLDRNVVAQAQAHLREQSPLQRVRWHRQIEVVLHRFARSQGYRRQPVHVGAGRTQVWWTPPKGSCLPLTDIQFLRDPTLHAFAGFQTLLREISAHAGLAQLVIASLLVRRDYRLRDYASIQVARELFDGAAASFARVAHRYLHDADHIRGLEEILANSYAKVQTLETQVARQQSATLARNQALTSKTAARHRPVLQYLEGLNAAKTPRHHWAKLTLKAMKQQGLFAAQEDPALLKMIQRDIKAYFPVQ
jgi:hypothetical protein